MSSFWQDLKHGMRWLCTRPGFTLTTAITLAIGIGTSSTIFGVVNAFLFRPSAGYREPDRIVRVFEQQAASAQTAGLSAADLADFAQSAPAFERIAAFRMESGTITGGEEAESVSGIAMSPGLLDIVGARVTLGREFLPEEYAPGRDRVALIGHGLWMRRFGGAGNVVGRSIIMNRTSYVIAGVLNSRPSLRGVAWIDPDFVTPFQPDAREDRAKRNLVTIARLRPEATLTQARTQLAAVSARLDREYAATNKGWRAVARGLRELDLQGEGGMFAFLMAGAILLVAVVCANVASLLLANGAGRERDMATRVALGASRCRIVRQLLAEILLLSAAGGALGVALACAARTAVAALVAGTNIGSIDFQVDGRVLLFAAAVSLICGLGAGLFPALRMSWLTPAEVLKQGGTLSSPRAVRMKALLVSGQVALSLAVMAGAGALLKGGWQIWHNDPGFRPACLLTMNISEPAGGTAAFDEMLERIRSLPGIENAGLTGLLPLAGGMPRSVPFYIAGRPRPEGSQAPVAGMLTISDGYFQTLGVPLLAGRTFGRRDTANSLPVAVINESLARKFWPRRNPVGAQVQIQSRLHTVVGIVGDIRTFHLVGAPTPELYLPHHQSPPSGLTLVARTKSPDPFVVANAVKKEIRAVDAAAPISRLHSMAQVIHNSMGGWRFIICLICGLAAFSLALAAVGLYALMSFIVSRRTREIGLKMALGASPRCIARDFARQGFSFVAWGAIPGFLASWAVLRLMSASLSGIVTGGASMLGIQAAMLTLVAAVASGLPAWRAMRVDPCAALRAE